MDLTADHFHREGVTDADLALCPDLADGYTHGDDVRPKFDSVAALILWQWSLDSGQDEHCGDAQYGNGWHALFRAERAVLHTGNSGFVSAWRVEDGKDLDQEWAEIERGAVYPDDAGAGLAEAVAESLALLDDNEEFDQARTNAGFPEALYTQAVRALRDLRDALNGG